jgi:hypothetical protein
LRFCALVSLICRIVRYLFTAVSIVFAITSLSVRAGENENWREKFNDVYKMDEGEALKRIAPPFIPERKTYYFKEEKDQARYIAEPPTYLCFHWTGSSFQKAGYGFIDSAGLSLHGILESVLELKTYEYQIPKEAQAFHVTGDWMVDVTAELEPKLQKLCDIMRAADGPSLKFVQKEIERPVIVARGTYAYHPIDGAYNATWVHLFVDKLDKDEGSGGGSGDLGEFLETVGDRVAMPVIDEVQEPRPKTVSWGYHSSSNFSKLAGLVDGPKKTEKIKKLLDAASKQTDLKLTIEQRKVSVWVAEPTPRK